MIKLDGKLLFEQWCKCRGVKDPVPFCGLNEEGIAAWNALADWLCRHEWEPVEFAWQKVLKDEAEDSMARMEQAKAVSAMAIKKIEYTLEEDVAIISAGETVSPPLEEQAKAEKAEVWKMWLDNTRAEHAALDHSTHHKACALRHGGIACTC